MGTTKTELGEWFDRGVTQGAVHMIVVCDTFDWEDYPVFVKPEEDMKAVHAKYDGGNMQKVMEVYDLTKDRDEQLGVRRAFNL